MIFTSKERNYLRKLAHNIEPLVRIGKNGMNEEIYSSISNAINTNELIKIKILNNSDVEITPELLENIENKTKSYIISIIGNSIIVFKPRYVNNKAGKITHQFMEFRKGK